MTTIEEATKLLKMSEQAIWLKGLEKERKEAEEMAIKALEQQPCDDCISRQAAINCVIFHEFRHRMVEDIKALPSVTPKEKTGRWIRQTDDYHDYYECEQCGIAVGIDDIKNYCPNCGQPKIQEAENE